MQRVTTRQHLQEENAFSTKSGKRNVRDEEKNSLIFFFLLNITKSWLELNILKAP